MNEENQVYFVDSDVLPPKALERKHKLEQDPSCRTNHMEYMEGMEIIRSDIQSKVLKAMEEYDYSLYTAADVFCLGLHHSTTVSPDMNLRNGIGPGLGVRIALGVRVCLWIGLGVRIILLFGSRPDTAGNHIICGTGGCKQKQQHHRRKAY